jgi:hypothetical protein
MGPAARKRVTLARFTFLESLIHVIMHHARRHRQFTKGSMHRPDFSLTAR